MFVLNLERSCKETISIPIPITILTNACVFNSTFHRTDEEIQEMIEEADRDNDDQVSADEFMKVMKKRSGNPEISSDEED